MSRNNFIFLIVIFCFALIPGLTGPFSSKGEPREALTAQSMLKTGNYILPKRYGDEIPTKPPLFHWMIVGTSKVTGELNEFSTRVPSLILSGLLAIIFYRWIKDPKFGIPAICILATSFVWFRGSINGRIDMALAFFLVLSFLEIFKWVNNRCKSFPILLNLCMSFAILAKGPIGIVLPGMVLVAYQLMNKFTFRELLENFKLLPSLLIPSLWYLEAYKIGGSEFINIVMNENVRRVTGDMVEYGSHSHSILYLFATLLTGLLPWTSVVPFTFKKTNFDLQLKFSILVCLCIFGFYCIPESKRDVYLLPMYPFIALIFAKLFSRVPDKIFKYYYWVFLGILFASIIAAFIIIDLTLFNYVWLLLPLVCLGCKTTNFNKLLVLVCLMFVSSHNVWFVHEAEAKTMKNFAKTLDQYPEKIYSFKERYYELSYYMEGRLADIPDQITEKSLVLVEQDNLLKFLQTYKQNKLILCAPGKKKNLCLYELKV